MAEVRFLKNTSLLKRFKEQNPELMALKPLVEILKIVEEYSSETKKTKKHSPHLLQINVWHPFIFDNRLIPKTFEEIEVLNITTGKTPKEFPDIEMMPLWEHNSIDNYKKFIENNYSEIQKKLGIDDKDEMLEALTGGSEELEKENRDLQREWKKLKAKGVAPALNFEIKTLK